MPTVDSSPQQEEWIDTFLHADAIMTYSDFGRDTLLRQSNNKINYVDTTSPGVSLDVFKPLPEEQRLSIKKSMGLENKLIVGSIMRNQKRKLFPELLDAFRNLVDQYKEDKNPIGENIYLYLHTSYPDAGWDIPLMLKEYNIGNRVLFSYLCQKCRFFRPSLFQHPMSFCPKCGSRSMSMPNVSNGLTQEELNVAINTFDMYVQYAICEGFGMPQVEAASAGVPIASVDYSAMSDVVAKLNAYPIKVNQFFRELETKAIRVYPDNNSLIKIIKDYFAMPKVLQEQKKHETRQLTEQYYNWDNIAKKWEHYLDNIKLTGLQGQWQTHLGNIANVDQIDMSGGAYNGLINWVSKHMSGHQMTTSMVLLNMIRDIDYGFVVNGMQTQGYDPDKAKQTLQTMINNHNTAMAVKDNPFFLKEEDDIRYANMKDEIK